jgi:hypothetical protein
MFSCTVVGDVVHGTRDRIVFSHKDHLDLKAQTHAAQQEMCAVCHYTTPKDIRGEEPGEPLEAQCLTCHAKWKTDNECWRCHTDKDNPLTYSKKQNTNKTFYNHARHNDRIERLEDRACDYCHKASWDEGPDPGAIHASEDMEDRWHDTCFKCHLMRTEWERMNCSKCHDKVSDSTGLRPLSRFHHEGNWLYQHGDQLIGRPDGIALCAKCHDRGYCSDCHDARDERRIRPELKWPDRPDRAFIHRGDYINRHAFEARTNPADCIRCHAVEGFCKTCHQQRGLVESTRAKVPAAAGNDRYFYPANAAATPILQYHNGSYADFVNPASPTFHGRTAARDAVLCASCHDFGKETVCIDCHADPKVKAPRIPGGNPHPSGFHSSIPMSAKPCSYCHLH